MSVEVDAAVVETSLQKQKSAASKEFKETVLVLKDIVGACEHEQAKMHCPQTCGLCAALGAQEDMMNRRQLDKCTGGDGHERRV